MFAFQYRIVVISYAYQIAISSNYLIRETKYLNFLWNSTFYVRKSSAHFAGAEEIFGNLCCPNRIINTSVSKLLIFKKNLYNYL